MKNLVQDLKDVIIEITDVKKRVEDLKLKIELAVGSSREPYRSWHNELNTIIKDLERILR